ncbi:MAG: LamG domain-containing protein [Akkermansiaceae bacterium]|nr:LamG domain-containing protein [Verrucomicrobiales bacterium]
MKPNSILCALVLLGQFLFASRTLAQTFSGTNAPGAATNYIFTLSAGATNLSLVISNTAPTYSYLRLAKGRAPTEVDYDFIARLNGASNKINLQLPEFSATNYGLRVTTPAASTAHAFTAVLTTNRTDLRTAGYPVLKPLAFTTTGTLTNPVGQGAFHYFQVDVPTNLPGWRIVLSSTNAAADLYVRRGLLPTTGSYDKASTGLPVDTVIFSDVEATTNTYFIGVYLPAGAATNTVYTLTTEVGWLTALTWDPGTTDGGTQVYTNVSASGGDYYFKITAQNTANGAWRTALKVTSGEADVYLRFGVAAQTNIFNFASLRVGADGFVLAQTAQWTAGQDWYLTVHATPGAQWTLLTGEAYVQQLPALAADASSGTNATIGPEGMRFFKTTITPGTLAWRLNLSGLTNTVMVDNSKAPVLSGAAGGGYYDWIGLGQLLLVPNYVNSGSQYFVGVIGNPGLNLTLDSRQQPVIDLAFNSTTNITATNYGYLTYRVQVPLQQIAWQVNLMPTSGDANLAVRRDNVPNEYTNDAFSEIVGSIGDSITMVPPILSDGTFYITTYGKPPYTCTLTNGQPVITDVSYVFQITNDAPFRSGWRFYRVVNTAEQLGTYGWDLALSNHLAGTEIALRRNAVPSRWNYRNCTANCTYNYERSFLDYSGTGGFLQRPGHQADIWYIGVYQPTNALGNFVLSGQELTGTPLSFNGPGSTHTITNQPPGKFQYFIFNVPTTNALGWDLRLINASGDPRLTICRDRLPFDLNTHDYNGNYWYYPWTSTSWPSGYSWGAADDWTSYYYNPGGYYYYGKLLAMGMGNPLQPGTYYVGVNIGSGNAPLSYTLVSRGIGTNLSIPVIDLPFTGGTAWTNNLPAREAAYYRVQIASNTPSWKLRLAVTNGEAMMLVQKDYLPNVVGVSGLSTSVGGGRRMQKAGDEHYLLLPDNTAQTNIPPGTYFIAVISEGQNPGSVSSTIGTGGCGFVLTSLGVQTTNQLGNLTAVGPDLSMPDTLPGGSVKHYQFTVSPGVLAMEVRLDNQTANPRMALRDDGLLVQSLSSYGRDAGVSYSWQSDTLIHIATPQPGTYTLSVHADTFTSGYSNATYTVVVHPLISTPVAFDGGTATITLHSNAVARYFTFDVPTNTFGWDLRLTNTSGDPRLVICRDLAPQDAGTHTYAYGGWYYPWTYTTWPSSNSWGAGYDWTSYYYDHNGTNRYGHILQMGRSNPLEPGRYYAGVFAANAAAAGHMNYTLVSRGIGTNQTIPILNLPFVGSVSGTNIPAREVVYYKVEVPAGMASWKLRLVPTNGEAMMLIQKDYLPNVVGGGSSPVQIAGGRAIQKAGREQFTQLPRTSEATITNGTYYVAVVSEGQNPYSIYIGTNGASYTLYSYGPATTNQLGTVDPSGATDITFNDSLEGGDFKFYQFSVPPGTLSLEVHLENRTANPSMTLRADSDLPRPNESYGSSDGHSFTWVNNALINIADPAPTNYTLCVKAHQFVSGYSNATYTIRLHALGLIPVAFNGGTNRIVNQAAGTWQYFTINVPTNTFGWDLRLTNITSGDPQLVICRDGLPDSLYTRSENGGGWYYPWTYTSWPSNFQWGAAYDWTSHYYNVRGSNIYGIQLQMGMGNPLSPGTYQVGVINGSGVQPMSYTIHSRGIGTNMAIPIYDLPYIGSVTTNNLPVSEAAYYRVTVPAGQRNWKLRLSPTSGDAMLMIQKDYLPNVVAGGSSPALVQGGRALQKTGNEQYLFLPLAGQSYIPGGTYYIGVVSEGMNPTSSHYGSNACNVTLTSFGEMTYTNLGNVNPTPILRTNILQAGEIGVFRFTVTNSPALEVRLDDKTGNSYLRMNTGTNPPYAYYSYGYNNGESPLWGHDRIITLPNVSAATYSLTIHADPATDAAYTLVVRELSAQNLAFDRTLSTPSVTNVASGILADLQHTYFRVTVPATFNGQPVLGWKLTLDHAQGNPRLRVRKDILPDDNYYVGNTPWNFDQMAVVPPYLTPGTWYVDVQGQGASQFTLTSSVLLLERPAWNMPAVGGSVTTPGLPAGGPLFGDTGVSTNGVNLPGDQGIDLEQGRFHYYAVVVPSNNVGVLRTRLDAISGDPDLYIRVNGAPTLSHYADGDYYYSGILHERELTANIGSEYGNWVPVAGRDELQLAPGIWYIAVQASGNSNVRYRLQTSVGVVANLVTDGTALISQTLAAGDWRYYRVFIPTNAPLSWNVTFSQNLGDVLMYVRDITPPGQGTTVTDYRHWQPDNKNFGPYPVVDQPGTTNFPCPPLRPGSYYYLGFRAVNDATFSVSCTTNTAAINYTNVIAFYGGGVTNVIPANGFLKYRIDVPADGRRWLHTSTHSNTVDLYLEQGSVPKPPSEYHWQSGSSANSTLNQALFDSSWPWRPAYSYFLLVTNTTAIPQNFVFNMNGKNAATDDNDGDGLPDAWELTYWPSIYSYNGNSDPDGDGVNNVEEFTEATTPTNSVSFNPRLLVNANNGIVTRNPVGNATLTPPKVWYAPNTTVQLSPTPNPGYVFLGWSGDASGNSSPYNLLMNAHKTVTANFGITNNSGADYQFQMDLLSSSGTPPPLQNIGAGNTFIGDQVDNCARLVLQFPLHNGVRLQPTASVIPTNIYTIVMLFRLDETNGYRRLIDFKAGTVENGVYVRNGRLNFYGIDEGATPKIPANVYVQVVLTRDGTNVVGYVNGVEQFSFVDSGNQGVISSANDLRFFKDNGVEESAGAVARIRLYAAAMPPEQVALLDRTDCITAPYFLRPYFLTNVLQLPVTSVIAGVTYRLQASTNLGAWSSIATGTPPANSTLFFDPQATNHLKRFYRLVTP